MLANPFVDPAHRLLRRQDAMLSDYLSGPGGNVVRIIGPRRIGKTALVLNFARQSECPFLNLRIRPIPANRQPAEVVRQLWDTEIEHQLDNHAPRLWQAYRKFRSPEGRSAQQSITAELNTLVFKVQAQSGVTPPAPPPPLAPDDALLIGLRSLERAAQETGLRPLVFFDEIQELLCASAEEEGMTTAWGIRNEIQAHQHVRYIFAGSNQKLFARLTTDRKAPLLNMGLNMTLPPLLNEEIEAWALPLLRDGQRQIRSLTTITRSVAGKIGEIVEVLTQLWAATQPGEVIDEQVQLAAVKATAALQPELIGVVKKLTLNQVTLLAWLLDHPGESPFERASGLSLKPGSIQTALRSLVADELVETFGDHTFAVSYPLQTRSALLLL